MKIALLVIGTGEKYRPYVQPLLESAKKYFVEHDAIVWTDGFFDSSAAIRLTKTAEGFPNETLHRYSTFVQQEWLLKQYDQLFYIDADMRFVAPVGEEIFSEGITATLHPGYVGQRGSPETDSRSLAYCPKNIAYYCGGFQGGSSAAYLKMAKELATSIEIDDKKGVTAIWHDESHYNRYLTDNPPAKILGPEYCYPDVTNDYYKDKWRAAGLGKVQPKILALTKGPR